MNFSQAMEEAFHSGRAVRRRAWGAPFYIKIDNRGSEYLVHYDANSIHEFDVSHYSMKESDYFAKDWEIVE